MRRAASWESGGRERIKYNATVLGLLMIIKLMMLMLMMIKFLLCLDMVFVSETSHKLYFLPGAAGAPHWTRNPTCQTYSSDQLKPLLDNSTNNEWASKCALAALAITPTVLLTRDIYIYANQYSNA